MSYQPAAKIRPSGAWYLIGTLALVAAAAAFVASLVVAVGRVSDEVKNFTSFTVQPEGIVATIDFTRAGEYTLYYRYESSAPEATQAVPTDLAVRITNVDAREVAFSKGGTSVSFDVSGKSGRSAGSFTLAAAGKYDIQVTGGRDRAPYTMSVGRGVLAKAAKTIALGALIAGVLGLLGLVTLIVTAVKRRQGKRIARAQAAAWAPAGGAPVAAAGPSWSPQAVPPSGVPSPAVSQGGVPSLAPPSEGVPAPTTSIDAVPSPPTPATADAVPSTPAPATVDPVRATPAIAEPPAAVPAEPAPPPPPPVPVPSEPGALPPPPPSGWGAPTTAPARSPWDPPPPPPTAPDEG